MVPDVSFIDDSGFHWCCYLHPSYSQHGSLNMTRFRTLLFVLGIYCGLVIWTALSLSSVIGG